MDRRREIAIAWIEKAKELFPGECLYIPVGNPLQQKELIKDLEKEIVILKAISPDMASSLSVTDSFADKLVWVVIKKTISVPLIAWKKKLDGTKCRVSIEKKENKNENND